MARVLAHSTFIHIPKCGGTFVRDSLSASMGADREVGPDLHCLPCQVTEVLKYKPAFLFVRKPETWYHSMWAYRMDQNWTLPYGVGHTSLDKLCKADKFETFIDKVYERCHGYCTTLFLMYVDNPPMIHIGKQENLIEDLVRFLNRFNEPFNEKVLRACPKKNVSIRRPRISQRARKRIRKMDSIIYERFKYA